MNSFFSRFLMSSGSALLILVYYPFAMNYVSFDIQMFVTACIGASVASIVSGAMCSVFIKKNTAAAT
jgi:hypothetical protein